MADKNDTYGQLIAMDEAEVLDEDSITVPREKDSGITSEGNMLWSYRQEGRIGNIPVAEEDRNLKVDNDELLTAAFELDQRPRSLLLNMSPGDEEGCSKYDELLERAYNGEIIIVEELKQFDPSRGAFVVWVRYNKVLWRLHPRFHYLREE